MKKIFLVLLLMSMINFAQEAGNNPVAVSPGSETEAVTILQRCPTFSWSSVDMAVSYTIAIFHAEDGVVLSYEEIESNTSPVILKNIAGRASSWTLPAEDRLQMEKTYVWYVRAVDSDGNTLGLWSKGRIFKVKQEIPYTGTEKKLGDTVKSSKFKAKEKQGTTGNAAAGNTPGYSGVQGSEAGANTYYGLNAGASLTTGTDNSFFGKDAGTATTSGTYNNFFGFGAGGFNTTGTYNHFFGWKAGGSNTTGNSNNFFGMSAGASNTTGTFNNYFGFNAGASTTTATANNFFGNSVGRFNTTGDANSFFGNAAGYNNTIGYRNSFFGGDSGFLNTTGYGNTFLGFGAGYSNTTAANNTFVGYEAGYTNTTAANNTFVGYKTGYSNTTGTELSFFGSTAGTNNTIGSANDFFGNTAGYSNTTGNGNNFFGTAAGYNNTTGNNNSFIGYIAGNSNTTGEDNNFLGSYAGRYNTTGSYNNFFGFNAGLNNTIGNYNCFIGHDAGYSNTTGIGNIFLGTGAGYFETGSNKLYIDNSNTTSPLIYGEFDNNILTVNAKLGINTNTPLYTIDAVTTGINSAIVTRRTDGATNFMSATAAYAQFGSVSSHPVRILVNATWKMVLNTDGSLGMSSGATCTSGGVWTNASSRTLKENIETLGTDEAMATLTRLTPVKYNYKTDKSERYVGFIAEDVPELVATADHKGLSPMDVTAVLTKVVKEQQKTIQEQQKTIAAILEKMAKLERN